MLYLGYVLLHYTFLIYNLKVSFNFHLTFLQLNVIKVFTVSKNCAVKTLQRRTVAMYFQALNLYSLILTFISK